MGINIGFYINQALLVTTDIRQLILDRQFINVMVHYWKVVANIPSIMKRVMRIGFGLSKNPSHVISVEALKNLVSVVSVTYLKSRFK